MLQPRLGGFYFAVKNAAVTHLKGSKLFVFTKWQWWRHVGFCFSCSICMVVVMTPLEKILGFKKKSNQTKEITVVQHWEERNVFFKLDTLLQVNFRQNDTQARHILFNAHMYKRFKGGLKRLQWASLLKALQFNFILILFLALVLGKRKKINNDCSLLCLTVR